MSKAVEKRHPRSPSILPLESVAHDPQWQGNAIREPPQRDMTRHDVLSACRNVGWRAC